MKRFFILLFSSLCFSLCLLSNQAYAQTLKIGFLTNNPPYSYTQVNKGFEFELAQQLGQNIKMVPKSSTTALFKALKKHQVDLVFSDSSQVPKEFNQTISFLHPANVLFRRHDSKNKTVLKLNQKSIGFLKNNPHQDLITNLGAKPKTYKTTAALLRALNAGKIKAAFLTDYQYSQLLAKNPQLVAAKDPTNKEQVAQLLVKITDPQVTSQNLVLASYHNKRIITKTNHKLKQLQKNGILTKLSMKYFEQDWTYQ